MLFHPPTQLWFESAFTSPTRAQELGWPAIQSGDNTLILAPTGSGKTLTAFLVAIDRLIFGPEVDHLKRCRVLYISPLKALAVDVEKNLQRPLEGVSRTARAMGTPFHPIEIAIRTGDTPSKDRAAFIRHPSDILITTPESLYLMLTSRAREALRYVNCVIIDEIHAMVNGKRGAHLSLSLERLAELTGKPLQRIGLSATQRPLEEVARFLGGFEETNGCQHPRSVQIVDAGQTRTLDLRVEVAVEDMARLTSLDESHNSHTSHTSHPSPKSQAPSIWPAIHPLLLDLIRSHRSTLIFVNSRRLAERLSRALNELAGEELVQAHHGSVAREQRLLIEEGLKSGRLPAIVATSSLELGIDMGAIDLVVQVEAPPGVSAGIQRIGRAGHQVGAVSKGVIVPKYRGDLLACAALTERMLAGAVEEMRYPRNPLDVLAQQIVAMVSMEEMTVDRLESIIRRAAPFAEVTRSLLEQTLDMLSGRFSSERFVDLKPRITWERVSDTLRSREGAHHVAVTSSGTIADRGHYSVVMQGAPKGQGRVGELDEEMVFESKQGDIILLGSSSWRVEEITNDRVIVSPAPGMPGRIPFWHGESVGRPAEFGRAIGKLARTLTEMDRDSAVDLLVSKHCLDENAAINLCEYLDDQLRSAGAVPTDKTILVESYRDEMGEWRVCILTPFGSRVHAPWAMAMGALYREKTGTEADILWTDDGIVLRLPETNEPPRIEEWMPSAEEVQDLVIRQLGVGGGGTREMHQGAPVNALFATRFRDAASRALLLPRKNPRGRQPMWLQRKRAVDLLNAATEQGSFPMVLEAFRECLMDVFDMPSLVDLLREIRSEEVQMVSVVSVRPSPFASALLFHYIANFMYEGDAPLAERRAQALMVDPTRLRELLGDVDLRELLDPDAILEHERYLQHLSPDRRVRHLDGLHDLLLRLGDLSTEEVAARLEEGSRAEEWLGELAGVGRVVGLVVGSDGSFASSSSSELRMSGDGTHFRWVAVEDVSRYCDSLGLGMPESVPLSLRDSVSDPVGDLIGRFARTHGPFIAQDVARRFGLGVAVVVPFLKRLEGMGRLVEGQFRLDAVGVEWCDSGVLRSIREKSLARLRREVEPAEVDVLCRLLLDRHHVTVSTVRPEPVEGRSAQDARRVVRQPSLRLIDIVRQLEGAPLPISILETQILAARIPDYDPRELDELLATGEVVWTGCGTVGTHDGRVRLLTSENAAAWITPVSDPNLLESAYAENSTNASGHTRRELREAVRSFLAMRGAIPFPAIIHALSPLGYREILETLWSMVWQGEVTNDSFHPVRAWLNPHRLGVLPKPRGMSGRRRIVVRGFQPASVRRDAQLPAIMPPESAGRWMPVDRLVWKEISPSERTLLRVRTLLLRYPILTRESPSAEALDGGFGAIYPVLKQMEEAGKVRRGYFVTGLGGAQFGEPMNIDRLRDARRVPEEPFVAFLAATDPANPFGGAIPWPSREDGRRATRSVGSRVIIINGFLAAWLGRGDRDLLTWGEVEDLAPWTARKIVAGVLAGARVLLETVDGVDADRSLMAGALVEMGFVASRTGMVVR